MEIGIEIVIAIIVVCLQVYFFRENQVKIRALSSFFPSGTWDGDFLAQEDLGSKKIQLIDEDEFKGEFGAMILSINKYLRRNSGNGDFNIIKNIVERRVENLETKVMATINVPLYIGLMGTFAGIITGLVTIAWGPGTMDNNITGMLGGVIVAMSASLFGLFLTVTSNSYYFKQAKEIADENQSYFFDFLQQELFPHLGNSLVEALDQFKGNINSFNDIFHKNISLFDQTFSGNITALKESVGSLSGTMDNIIENTKTQQEFIQEIKKLGQLNVAKTNLEIYRELNALVPHLINFQNAQEKLNATVDTANNGAESINRIMNRIQSFEKSLNNLGEVIDNRKFLANEILIRVDKNLEHLERDYGLLKDHELATAERINIHLNSQYEQIRRLTDKVQLEISDALNFNVNENPLKKLLLLDSLNKHLSHISEKVDQINELANRPVEPLDIPPPVVQEPIAPVYVPFPEPEPIAAPTPPPFVKAPIGEEEPVPEVHDDAHVDDIEDAEILPDETEGIEAKPSGKKLKWYQKFFGRNGK